MFFFPFFWDLVIFKAKWGDVSIIICFLFFFWGGGDGDDVGVDVLRIFFFLGFWSRLLHLSDGCKVEIWVALWLGSVDNVCPVKTSCKHLEIGDPFGKTSIFSSKPSLGIFS